MENGSGRDVARVIDMLAIGREDGFAQFLLMLVIGLLHQLNPCAARHMVKPDFAGTQRTARGEMLLGGDEAAIGAPAWLIEQAEILFAHLPFVGTVAVHDPDIVAAAPVGGKGNARSIGGKARLGFEGQAFGNAGRRAAGDGHGVDVTQQIERDGPAIGADVKVHPRTFVGIDRNLAEGQAGGRRDIPFGRLVFGGSSRGGGRSSSLRKCRCRNGRCTQQQDGLQIMCHFWGSPAVFFPCCHA